ncbi:hypothetical protein N3K66_004949 [Trichothecium roseum]|uniref:Uncharacterized protein n=1 Tax=Trichothecium roseum TaxID=47278 RepID=A0ACC0V393_9HYPO|nr:hypothetical protein N3K66_004949 [Trichothecium roseum]
MTILGMAPATGKELLFSSYLGLTCVYWIYFKLVEVTVRRFFPDFHRANNINRMGDLLPAIVMIVRGTWGLLITFPACVAAAATTPWERGQDMNAWGQVCLATQAATWAGELHLQNEVCGPVFFHHVASLLVLANQAMFTKVHAIKAVYIFLAAQLGDLTFCAGKVLRKCGLSPRNSWRCWTCTLGSGVVSVFSKCTSVLWLSAQMFESPARGVDWLWGFCLHFFAAYTLEGVCYTLHAIGFFTHHPPIADGCDGDGDGDGGRGADSSPRRLRRRRRRHLDLFIAGRWRVSQFCVMMTLAGLAAVWLRVSVYVYLKTERVGDADVAAYWAESLAFVGLYCGAFVAACTRLTCLLVKFGGNVGKGELYLRFAAAAVTTYVLLLWPGGALVSLFPDGARLLAATVVVLSVWDSIVRVGICAAASATADSDADADAAAITSVPQQQKSAAVQEGDASPPEAPSAAQASDKDVGSGGSPEQKQQARCLMTKEAAEATKRRHVRRIVENVLLLGYLWYFQGGRFRLVEKALLFLGATNLTPRFEDGLDTLLVLLSSSSSSSSSATDAATAESKLYRRQRCVKLVLSLIQGGLVVLAQYGFATRSLPFGAMVVTSLIIGILTGTLSRVFLQLYYSEPLLPPGVVSQKNQKKGNNNNNKGPRHQQEKGDAAAATGEDASNEKKRRKRRRREAKEARSSFSYSYSSSLSSWARTLSEPYVWCTIVAVLAQGYSLRVGLWPEPYDGAASASVGFTNLMRSMATPASILSELGVVMAALQAMWLSSGGIGHSV